MAALGDEARAGEMSCTGGGSNSHLVMKVKACMLGRVIKRVRTPELVAVGAALLAAGRARAGPAQTMAARM